MLKWSVRIIGVLAILYGLLCLWAVNTTLQPEALENAQFSNARDTPVLQPGAPLKILNWNVQFLAANRDNHFFFDQGPHDWPVEDVLIQSADAIAKVIIERDPDIVLLQEVDEGAKRTYFQDQLALLQARLPTTYSAESSTFYWQADFLPLPELWGPVGMKLAVLSKVKIKSATRFALAGIRSHSWLEANFQPRRAILDLEIEREGGQSVHVLNTHLSAFAQGTNTMELQVAQVMSLMKAYEAQGKAAVIGGDFNLVPTQEARNQLPERTRAYYNPLGTEIAPLLSAFASVPSLRDMSGEQSSLWHTHSSNDSEDKTPNKTLDYFFMTQDFEASNPQVLHGDALPISDHMPVLATFSLRQTEPK